MRSNKQESRRDAKQIIYKIQESYGIAIAFKINVSDLMKQNILTLLAADTLAPEQFSQICRRSADLVPEKALLLAVLEDAVDCLLKFHSARDRIGKRRFHEAEEWIMQSGSDWVFSFENVCELLRLDPTYLRQGLRPCSAKMSRRTKVARYQGLRRHAAS